MWGERLTLYPDMAGEGGCSCFGRTDSVFLGRELVLIETVPRADGR